MYIEKFLESIETLVSIKVNIAKGIGNGEAE